MKLRERIFNKFGGHCAYCGIKLQSMKGKHFNVDHKNPVIRYNTQMRRKHEDNEENMMPACPSCNNYKGSLDLETFREWLISMLNEKPERKLFMSKTKMQISYNFGTHTELKKWDGVFYFEKLKIF